MQQTLVETLAKTAPVLAANATAAMTDAVNIAQASTPVRLVENQRGLEAAARVDEPVRTARAAGSVETDVVRPPGGAAANEAVNSGVKSKAKLFGPYHRVGDSSVSIKAIQVTGELTGNPARNYMPSPWPKVKAYEGALPEGKSGFEFFTNVAPDVGHVPGQPTWMPTRPGVVERDGQAVIKCIVTKVGC